MNRLLLFAAAAAIAWLAIGEVSRPGLSSGFRGSGGGSGSSGWSKMSGTSRTVGGAAASSAGNLAGAIGH